MPLARIRKTLVDEGYYVDWLVAIVLVVFSAYVPNNGIDTTVRYQVVDDASLTYPFRPSTVTNAHLMIITFGVPVAAFSFSLLLHRNVVDWHHACLSLIEGFSLAFTFKRWLNLVGRYRPDWFSRLATGLAPRDGRLAYPSGHAAFSMVGMTVLSCYAIGKLQLFSRPSKGCFAKALLALSPVMFAVYVAATRLVNYKHDFSDVNAGCFIGLTCGLFAYFLNFNSFSSPSSAEPKQQPRDGWATGFLPAPSPSIPFANRPAVARTSVDPLVAAAMDGDRDGAAGAAVNPNASVELRTRSPNIL